jgi:hypothetical protein
MRVRTYTHTHTHADLLAVLILVLRAFDVAVQLDHSTHVVLDALCLGMVREVIPNSAA